MNTKLELEIANVNPICTSTSALQSCFVSMKSISRKNGRFSIALHRQNGRPPTLLGKFEKLLDDDVI